VQKVHSFWIRSSTSGFCPDATNRFTQESIFLTHNRPAAVLKQVPLAAVTPIGINHCDSTTKVSRLNKIFGVDLKGAGISIVLLLLAIFTNQKLDGSSIRKRLYCVR
jgi:hypothetical protein